MTKENKTDEFTGMKKVVIDALAEQIGGESREKMSKEFGLTEEQLEKLIRKMLDAWLNNPDYIMFIASMLGLSMPRKTKEGKAHYIG